MRDMRKPSQVSPLVSYKYNLIIILLQAKSLVIIFSNYPLYPQVTVQSGTVSEAPYSRIAPICSFKSQSAMTISLLTISLNDSCKKDYQLMCWLLWWLYWLKKHVSNNCNKITTFATLYLF